MQQWINIGVHFKSTFNIKIDSESWNSQMIINGVCVGQRTI